MAKLTSSGASWPTMRRATEEFEVARAAMSPAMRWEKNSMGRWSTLQMNEVYETTDILPSTRSSQMAFIAAMTTWAAPTSASATTNGTSQSGLESVRRRSAKICDSAGFTMPMTEVTAAVIATKASAATLPRRRSIANEAIDAGAPPGSKPSPGCMHRQMPVKERSKVSRSTWYSPRPGSLR